jgi:hypothetical protein
VPLATNPDALCKITLESDADIDEAERPAFIFRFLTGRELRKVTALQDTLEDCGSGAVALDQTFEAAELGLIGWTNMTDREGKPIIYKPGKLADVVGLIEASELIAKKLRQRPDATDKKKLSSPSLSDTEESAKSAEA